MTDLYGAVMAWSNLQFGYGLGLTNPIACKYTMNTSAERLALSKNKIVVFFPPWFGIMCLLINFNSRLCFYRQTLLCTILTRLIGLVMSPICSLIFPFLCSQHGVPSKVLQQWSPGRVPCAGPLQVGPQPLWLPPLMWQRRGSCLPRLELQKWSSLFHSCLWA